MVEICPCVVFFWTESNSRWFIVYAKFRSADLGIALKSAVIVVIKRVAFPMSLRQRIRRTLPVHGRDRMEKTVPNFGYRVFPTRNDKPYRTTDVIRSATSGFVRSWIINQWTVRRARNTHHHHVHHWVREINLLLYGIKTICFKNIKKYS